MSTRTSQQFKEECLFPTLPVAPDPAQSCGLVDPQCSDPVFAAANPGLCGNTPGDGGGGGGGGGNPPPVIPVLLLKPLTATIVPAGTLDYASYVSYAGVETLLTQALTYTSSNPSVATINATTGVATGVAPGTVTISVVWQGQTATAQLTVVSSCINQTTDIVLLIDNSVSMQQPFNGAYPTKGDFAKAAAQSLVSNFDFTVGSIAVVAFNTSTSVELQFSQSPSAVANAVANLPQSDNNTDIFAGIASANAQFALSGATQRIIVLFTDGANHPSTAHLGDNPVTAGRAFRDAGGLLIPVGVRAGQTALALLNNIGTPSYTVNAYDALTAAEVVLALPRFLGYHCSANTGSGYGPNQGPPPDAQIPDPYPLVDSEGPAEVETYVAHALCTRNCPPGSIGNTVRGYAPGFSTISVADAYNKAQAAACAYAQQQLRCCTNNLIINDFAVASPYPACYSNQDFSDTITSVQLYINTVSHTYMQDIAAVLVSPAGTAVPVIYLNGGPYAGVDLELVFDDSASYPQLSAPPISGTYATTTSTGTGVGSQICPAPCPAATGTSLTAFNGESPLGTWHLYVKDIKAVDTGAITSWSVLFNNATVSPCGVPPGTITVDNYPAAFAGFPICVPDAAIFGNPTLSDAWVGGALTHLSNCAWNYTHQFVGSGTNQYTFVATVGLTETNGIWGHEIILRANFDRGIGTEYCTYWVGRKYGPRGTPPTGVYNRVAVATDGAVNGSSGPDSITLI